MYWYWLHSEYVGRPLTFAFNLFHLYKALLQFHRRTHFTDKKMNDREKTLQNKSCVATKSTQGRWHI